MQKKQQSSIFKILILLGLLFIEGPVFLHAQENAENQAADSKPAATEDHNTEDLEKLLKRYNTDSEKILEDSSKLHNIQEGETKSEVNDADIEEMRPSDMLGKASESAFERAVENRKKNQKAKPIDQSFSNSVRLALSEVQKLSEAELMKRFDEATKDSPMRPYMEQFPNVTLFSVRLIKDKESIPSIVKIVEDKDKLIWFTGVMIFTIVIGFLLKRFMHKEGRSFIRAFFYFFLRMYIMLALRIGIIYYFYHVEFTPAAKVFKATFID